MDVLIDTKEISKISARDTSLPKCLFQTQSNNQQSINTMFVWRSRETKSMKLSMMCRFNYDANHFSKEHINNSSDVTMIECQLQMRFS